MASPPVLSSVFILFKAVVIGWAPGEGANFSAHMQCCAAQWQVELFSNVAPPARGGWHKALGARFYAHVQAAQRSCTRMALLQGCTCVARAVHDGSGTRARVAVVTTQTDAQQQKATIT